MIDFEKILAAYPNGVLATQDGAGVKTRVFQYLFTEGNKVYFSTSSDKPVYRQLKANPLVSFCTFAPDFTPVLSVNGRAVFVDDMALKTRALDMYPMIKGIYGGPENPAFTIFYIDAAEVVTFDFAEGEKTYKF